ncbi:MAG: hypothetical protein L0312_05560 [Acidobacteria bacterium]|nr:hypothetical protein [Acidobacteriota bacterium]
MMQIRNMALKLGNCPGQKVVVRWNLHALQISLAFEFPFLLVRSQSILLSLQQE